ncbi:MAG: periplasmic protein TonB [Blastocatellia bacterium]|jgi:protein TonB|nr:periplasmic protein TonB [Blastocatellia bacterium]
MFNNLIESQSHKKDFKRRGSFVLVTLAGYALFFAFAGVLSIYAYDAQLENQQQDLTVLSWVPPVAPPPPDQMRAPKTTLRPTGNNNGPERPPRLRELYEDPANPHNAPEKISTTAERIPPAQPGAIRDPNAFDPDSSGPSTGPIGGSRLGSGEGAPVVGDIGEAPPIRVKETPVAPRVVNKPILNGYAISLPKPPYPLLARNINVQGTVSVQVLLNEAGKVVSAKAVSGHPILVPAAVNAAYQARFSPTLLGGQPVRVSGVITYNFRLN